MASGNSPRSSPVWGFQHSVLLSLPEDSKISLSCWHHESERTPCSCPCKVLSGAFEFRRSHSKITGAESSGVAVNNYVALFGSHAIASTALRLLFRFKVAFFVFKSHTVTNPPTEPVARICGTFLFQAMHSKSSDRA